MGGGGICPSLYSLTSTIGYHIQSFLTSGHCCPFCPIDPWSSRLFGPLDLLLSRPYPSRSLIFPLFGPLDPWSSRPLDPWSERPRISLAGPLQNLLVWPEPVSSTFAITQLEPNLVQSQFRNSVYEKVLNIYVNPQYCTYTTCQRFLKLGQYKELHQINSSRPGATEVILWLRVYSSFQRRAHSTPVATKWHRFNAKNCHPTHFR